MGTNRKYFAKSVVIDGIRFPSTQEGDCYKMLRPLIWAGEIRSLEFQVLTKLVAGVTHRTDFKCWDVKRDEPLWIEAKGFVDQRWRDIRKLWAVFGPGRLKVYEGYGNRIKLVEEIVPNREGCQICWSK